MAGCDSRGACANLVPVDDNGTKVVDVREGRPGRDEVAKPREKFSRIVIGKVCGGIEAEHPGSVRRAVVGIGAGGVVARACAAVRSIGVGGDR